MCEPGYSSSDQVGPSPLLNNEKYWVLISLSIIALFLIADPFLTSAEDREQTVAEKAKAILEARCFQCHGKDGVASRGIFILDRAGLVSSKVLIPGDGNSLLLKMVESGGMPLGGPELPREEKEVL